MIINATVAVAAPREQVFDLMADVRNEPEWNSSMSKSDLTSDEPIGSGATFVAINRGRPYDVTLSTHDRADRLVMDVDGSAMSIHASFDFADESTGTSVAATFDMQPKGVMKAMMPLMGGAIRKSFPKELDSFRQFCESRASA